MFRDSELFRRYRKLSGQSLPRIERHELVLGRFHHVPGFNGNFSDLSYQRLVTVALSAFNDGIIRVATGYRVDVIELRQICNRPEDYANLIDPSTIGGEKIAKVIVREIHGRNHGAALACIAGK